MSDQNRTSKPPKPSGISAAEGQQLRSQVANLTKLVQEHLAEKNQWSAEARSWVGKETVVSLLPGDSITGQLLWIDRYTIALQTTGLGKVIIHKAAIVFMHLRINETA